jgi:DNA polymerase-1
MKKIAIIDGNGLSYGIYQQLATSRTGLLENSVGVPTSIIFGMIRSINNIIEELCFDDCILCWDTRGSAYRKKIWPEYKQARKKVKKDFDINKYFDELETTRNFFKQMGLKQFIANRIEADDCIGWLARKLSKRNKIYVISNDKDFFQILRKNVKIYRPIKKEIITEGIIRERYSLENSFDYCKILSLIGDKDEVPGIFRLGEVTAIKLLKEYEWNLKKLIEECNKEFYEYKDGEKKTLKDIEPSRWLAFKMARIRTLDKLYEDWELETLKIAFKDIGKNNQISIKKIKQLSDFLEFKSINLPYVLKRMGVNVKGKINKLIKV